MGLAKLCGIIGALLSALGAAIIAHWAIYKQVQGPSPYGAINYREVGERRFVNSCGLFMILLGLILQILQLYVPAKFVVWKVCVIPFVIILVLFILYVLAYKYWLPEYIAYLYSPNKVATLQRFKEKGTSPSPGQLEELGVHMNCTRHLGESDEEYLSRITDKVLSKVTRWKPNNVRILPKEPQGSNQRKKRMRRLIIEITIALAIAVIYWLFHHYALEFFIALGIAMLSSLGMAVYLVVRWRHLPRTDRMEGIFALVGWLILAYVIIRANGLTIGSLFS